MKGFFTVMMGILLFCMVIMPVAAIKPAAEKPKTNTETQVDSSEKSGIKSKVYNSGFKVKFVETGKIKTVDKTEYLVGVLAGEMPASYQTEALKAQTVAAYTYACFKKQKSKNKYHVTDSEQTDQKYLTAAQRKKKWGKDYKKYEFKLKSVVKSVENQQIFYNGKIITAVYHAVSSGKTENAENVWGKGYPYLKSVESVGDILSENYLTTVEVTEEQFKKMFAEKGAKFSGTPKNFVKKVSKTESGTVKSITVGGKKFTGAEIREMFSLRSACFDIEYKQNKFVFSVKGYGHMLGLSQYGANFMAKQGNNYKEILLWYYSGCKLVTVEL